MMDVSLSYLEQLSPAVPARPFLSKIPGWQMILPVTKTEILHLGWWQVDMWENRETYFHFVAYSNVKCFNSHAVLKTHFSCRSHQHKEQAFLHKTCGRFVWAEHKNTKKTKKQNEKHTARQLFPIYVMKILKAQKNWYKQECLTQIHTPYQLWNSLLIHYSVCLNFTATWYTIFNN